MITPWVTLCIQCHNFQRRLCWMLSSLLPQKDHVVVDVAHLAGNGNPTTREVANFFRAQGLQVRRTRYEPDQFGHFETRGPVRTDQLANVTTPWVLWTDSDMVYSPDFFPRLLAEIDQSYDGIYAAGRLSQEDHGPADGVLGIVTTYPSDITTAWATASQLPAVTRRNCGAGYFQLIRADACGGYYVRDNETRDGRWSGKGQKASSDKQFRHRIGKLTKLPHWFTTHQIHLNHVRDNEIGHHTEEQR